MITNVHSWYLNKEKHTTGTQKDPNITWYVLNITQIQFPGLLRWQTLHIKT